MLSLSVLSLVLFSAPAAQLPTPPAANQVAAQGFWNGDDWVPLVSDGRAVGLRFDEWMSTAEIRAYLASLPGLAAGQAAETPIWLGQTVVLNTAEGTSAAQAWAWSQQHATDPGVLSVSPRLWTPDQDPYFLTEEILVRWRPEVSAETRAAQVQDLSLSASLDYTHNPGQVFRVAAGVNALARANELAQSGLVEFAIPDFQLLRISYGSPNDPLYGDQWHLESTGQGGTGVDEDIDAEGAWALTHGSANVTIAVVDTGVELQHPDLIDNIIPGIDVLGNDNDPQAEDGTWLGIFKWEESHGTSTNGVAAGRGDNGLGISGVAPRCTLMPIRFLSELFGPSPTVQDEADAFNFACANGASVINNSWGPAFGATLPASTKAAIDNCNANGRGGLGAIIFFAAGNSGSDNSNNGYASYSGVLGVSAATALGRLAGYSSFGSSVDCCAPSSGDGFEITTTDRLGSKGYTNSDYTPNFGGTSSASPCAAGVMALVLSANPGLSRAEAIEVLLSTAEKIDQANGNYDANGHSNKYGYGRVNAAAAVAESASRATGGGANSIYLNGPTYAAASSSVSYQFTNAAPHATYYALASLSPLGTLYQGHQFDLSPSDPLIATGTTSPTGTGTFNGTIPASLSGMPLFLEVAASNAGTWQDSNLVLVRVF